MKINIEKIARKYQVGGSIIYQPIAGPAAPPSQPAPAGKKEEAAEGPLDKDYIKKLMGAGITNDVNAFSSMVNNAYIEYSTMSNAERDTTRGRRLRDIMKGDLGQMNQLRRAKDLFTNVVNNIQKIGAGSDFAVTNRGVIVKDMESGNIAEVSSEEYASQLRNGGRYQMLTNAQLINEREYNPNLTNDQQSISALGTAVSMNQVATEVRGALKNLGSQGKSTKSDSYLGYGTTQNEAVEQAARQIVGMGAQGYYKISDMATNNSNLSNLQLAATAMWDNLSENSRNLLKARAAQRGVSAGSLEAAAKEMAVSLLAPASRNTETNSRTLSYDSQMTSDASGGKSDKLDDGLDSWQVLLSQTGDPMTIKIKDGNGSQADIVGYTAGAFKEDGKNVGTTSIRNVPTLTQFANLENIIIGNNQVRPDLKDAIVYNGGPVASADVPVINEDGVLKPDYNNIPLFTEVTEKLKRVPAGNVIAKEQIIKNAGLPSDGRGGIALNTARFLIFNGSVPDAALVGTPDTKWLKELSSEARESYLDKYTKDSSGKDVAGTNIVGGTLLQYLPFTASAKIRQGQVYVLASSSTGYVQGRLADGSKLNVNKSVNTPTYLGTAQERARMNATQSGAPLYKLN